MTPLDAAAASLAFAALAMNAGAIYLAITAITRSRRDRQRNDPP